MKFSLTFSGGVRTVTGSMHLITINGSKILLDAGLFQGKRAEFYEKNSSFPVDPSTLDAVIISHAHIDHCGNFPTLVTKGFSGPAYCTPTTKQLCRFMLPDSGYIQEEDIKYLNKILKRKGHPQRKPLYTQRQAKQALGSLRGLEYHKKIPLVPKTTLTFFDSGHILGSSIPVLDIADPKHTIRVAYAVDLGRPDMPFLGNPEIPSHIDYLVIESTYGARNRPDRSQLVKDLAHVINKTAARRGKVIIPAFALERSQEIIYYLCLLIKTGAIQPLPIFIDGPLTSHVTDVFRDNWDLINQETKKLFRSYKDLFNNNYITFIRNVNESKKLHHKQGPMIIVSASGMCENGRILHHLKNNIESLNNTIIIVGYMAENTLGRRIAEQQPTVNIFGNPHKLRAEVVIFEEFSSHADKRFLQNYIRQCLGNLKKVFIVHGEPQQSRELKKSLASLPVDLILPEEGQSFILS
ncbi:MAG: MBL fold metallo-hydrolase [Elusimicrobia bacterium]|nr:MBL fold metallo-hydrolase [Elusimicrobiota bacterium]MBD3412193.1 MBL fold metallo-hydrolase [Elusimicrobiota bacterium]